MPRSSHCASCGREFSNGLVIVGFEPCKCGGHTYAWCRDDDGRPGCGHTTYDPPMAETCRRVRFGYEGTRDSGARLFQ